MAKYSPTIHVMIKAAEAASRSLVRDFGEVEQLQVSKKGPGDFVSAADRRAEDIIQKELLKARPGYSMIMEESGRKDGSDPHHTWIVDPLDGTTNFLHGIPHWAISIALQKDKEIVAGLIYDPIKDELFYAEKGTGAFMRNKRLRVSGRSNMADSVIAAGSPALTRGNHARFQQQSQVIMQNTAAFRRQGAAALDLAYVAAGRYEGFWEYDLSPWDVAAGYIIVREAGGMITTISGQGTPLDGKSVLASNEKIYKDLKELLNQCQKQDQASLKAL